MQPTAGPGPTRRRPDARAARAARTRGFRGLRGGVAGAVSAVGALAAHLLAGGTVVPVPGVVVTVVAVALAVRATPRHEIGVARLAGLAVLAQVLGHLCLMMAPGGADAVAPHAHGAGTGHPPFTPAMLGTHALVAFATVVVAGGLDAAVLAVLRAAAGWLLPILPDGPVLARIRLPLGCTVRLLHGRRGRRSARPRAPPSVLAPAACAAR